MEENKITHSKRWQQTYISLEPQNLETGVGLQVFNLAKTLVVQVKLIIQLGGDVKFVLLDDLLERLCVHVAHACRCLQ